MAWFTKSARPTRTLRTSLRLEELGTRAMPDAGLDDPNDPYDSTDDSTSVYLAQAVNSPAPAAPVISNFVAIEVGQGWYQIQGNVAAAQPEGLKVTFAGVPAVDGQSAMTDAKGNFVLVVRVKTDGSDAGTITAQTVDANGNQSNIAMTNMDPT